MPKNQQDEIFMRQALRLARRGLGRVAPNPAVGCVIVQDGVILGLGHTRVGAHAETIAIKQAENNTKGATAYVTLEPCAHHGQTPPCSTALIKAGIARVVVAMLDPDSRVNGRGIAELEAAGIAVTLGVMQAEAQALNLGFILHRTKNRPLVTLKIATSANGMMCTPKGQPAAITSAPAQRRMHLIRAEHDAIMVGRGTYEADNPALTCRLAGMKNDTRRFIAARSAISAPDMEVLRQESVAEMLTYLAGEGITRLMLEGGPKLAQAFLAADLVDEIAWFRASYDLGHNLPHDSPSDSPPDSGTSSDAVVQSDLQFMGLDNLLENAKFSTYRHEICAPDDLYLLRRNRAD